MTGSLTFCDWFAGVGGIRMGLERAGHRCVWSCELDETARSIYAVRFGREPEGRDIRDIRPEHIPDADLWAGGFPCQDLSTAGRRTGIHGERSGLIWKLLDLAKERRPSWLLLENVRGLLTGQDGDVESGDEDVGEDAAGLVSWFGTLLGALAELDYVGQARVLDAQFFGVPQRRRRVFILARRAGEGRHPAAILFEPEGVRRDLEARRAEGEALARGAAASARDGSSEARRGGVARPLTAREQKGPDSDATSGNLVPEVAGTLGTPRGGGFGYDLDTHGAFIPGVAAPISAYNAAEQSYRGDGADNVIAVPIQDVDKTSKSQNGAGVGEGGDPMFTLQASTRHGFALGRALRGREGGNTGELSDVVPAIRDGSAGGSSVPMVVAGEVAATLTGGGHPNSAIPGRHSEDDVNLIAFDPTQLTHPENRSKCEPGAQAPALAALARAPHLAAYSVTPESGQGADLRATATATATACTATDAKKHERGTRIVEGATVRRLTPRECERLQGMPDDHTLILRPVIQGQLVQIASDAQRYKVIGNSVAIVVLEWIGRNLYDFVAEEREGQ